MDKRITYTEFSLQLNDKNNVVLEFGRHYTKCGFAGEPAPRAIIRTCVTDEITGLKIHLHQTQHPEELKKHLGTFIDKIYFSHLAVSPKEKKVVIVESLFVRSKFRDTLAYVLFERFNVPSITFVPDHLMALSTLGRTTGLIVDIGAEEAISIPVVDGITPLDCAQFTNLGAKTLDELILRELSKENPSLNDQLSPEVVEDVRIKTCFVAPYERGIIITANKASKSKLIQQEALRLAEEQNREISLTNVGDCYFLADADEGSPQTIEFSVNGQRNLRVPGTLREGACELFFEILAYEHSLTTMIVRTILMAPIDCRRSLAENILVIGGLTNLPGLEHRLYRELMNVAKYGCFNKKIPNEYKIHRKICPGNYVSWLGASMFCTPCAIELRETTRDQWDKCRKRSPNEWSDFVHLKTGKPQDPVD